MTDIKLGQSINGSLTANDPKLNRQYFLSAYSSSYDEYDLSGLDSFRQIKIGVEGLPQAHLELIDSATGNVIDSTNNKFSGGNFSLSRTTFPGINYKVRVSGANLGDYKLSLIDGGKATSIITAGAPADKIVTIGASGEDFNLSIGKSSNLTDVALAPNGQFYGISANGLSKIDPSLTGWNNTDSKVIGAQVATGSLIKDTQGNTLSNLNALEFSADNQLYAIGGDKFYQIDVNTNLATLKANLPLGFNSSGDIVYDATNNRFLATSKDTGGDALWQIPASNLAGASKIGSTGFGGIQGLSFENGQLTGFGAGVRVKERLRIDVNTGKGTLENDTSSPFNPSLSYATGASTIFTNNSTTTPINPTTSTNPTTPLSTIGNKSQTSTQRTIDLTDYQNQTLKVDITTKGDAAYNNNIGFYTVEDSLGTIKLTNGNTLKPGDANYAVEAVRNAVKNAGLQAGKNDSKPSQDIVGGQIYAPVVVAQGSLDDFINKNPTNGGGGNDIHAYFNYIGANSDNFDHFRLIGSNVFAVEDQYGGGDKDFNDLVVNMNVKTV